MLEWITVYCVYCGEAFVTAVDCSAGDRQDYIEDCQICCQPIVLTVTVGPDGELLQVETRAENH